jgi:hypothetical protein
MKSIIPRMSGLALLAVSLQAGVITGFNSRGSFGGDDTLQWGVAADEGSAPASPFARTSAGGGITANASLPGNPNFLITVEGSISGGNFALGDVLLSTDTSNGPISIAFSSPIAGVGMQMQRNVFGAFDGLINVYGAGNTLFGTITNNLGDSNGSVDNSAIFVGAKSSLTDIVRIELQVANSEGSANNQFIINFLSLQLGTPAEIPEPATMGLVGTVLAVLAMKRRSR